VLGAFRRGRTRNLVATDVAARGLDVPEVDLVVHYQLPDQVEAYQHRSGRTARAGRSGTVALLVGGRELGQVRRFEAALRRRFERAELPAPEAARTARLRALVEEARSQPEEKKAELREIAETWIKAQDVDALAGLLALLISPEKPPRAERPKRRRVRRWGFLAGAGPLDLTRGSGSGVGWGHDARGAL
jgi:ATP-dependent RNA helicase DeaD